MKIHPVFNVDLLSFAEPNPIPSRMLEPPPPVITDEGEEEWEVETILNTCHHGHGLQYLVKWKRYEDATWQPEADLKNAQEAIEQFYEQHPKAPK